MSLGEKSIFGLLAASIGLGVYDLATSSWGEQQQQNEKGSSSSLHDDDTVIQQMGNGIKGTVNPTVLELTQDLKPKRTTLAVEDGVTRVETTLQPPKAAVDDGVTDIRFGDAR